MGAQRRPTTALRLTGGVLAAIVALVGSLAVPAGAGPLWPTYHGDAARTGNDTTEPALLPIKSAWTSSLDGAVFGQPLVYDGRVIAATENNSVYGLDAHDGHVLWHFNAGPPLTNVVAQTGCGNIDPLGITSTAVVDTASGEVFVVAEIADRPSSVHHELIGLDANTGIQEMSANADPPANAQDPLHIQQRAGLAVGNGRVYVGYGGLVGDCGTYHGWLVSTTESGAAKVSFDATPNGEGGAIWATSGPAIDAVGDVYVTTGNPNGAPSAGDLYESVVKLDPTLHVLSHFSSSNATADEDLGSVGPSLLPGNRLFQTGKQHEGYVLDTKDLTTALATVPTVCTGEADGGNAYSPTLNFLFVPCGSTPITALNMSTNPPTIAWTNPSANGPPILAGGELWSVSWTDGADGILFAINPATGHTDQQLAIGSTLPHFTSPSAALGLILVGTDAGISAFDGPSGPPPPAPPAPLLASCQTQPTHDGYWMAGADGGIFTFGGAPFCGSEGSEVLAQRMVGMAGTPGPGYWLVARDGGVFSFNRPFFGSMGGSRLNAPIVGMAATPSGNGYWLVASDGGIFTFGDAAFHGSTGNIRLNAPIVGMAATPSGNGYWLVASDGGIFTFGDAAFHGSTGNIRLNAPIVGMAATPSGNGYWLVASDGGIFTFGDAAFHGSTGNIRLNAPIVGMAATPSGNGYWLVASDGGIFTFGDAAFHGSTGNIRLNAPVVAIAHD